MRDSNLPKPDGYSGYAAMALLFRSVERDGQNYWGVASFDITAIGDATVIGDASGYLGPNPPDLSLILLPFTGAPHVRLSTDPIREGEILAFVGFPMGTRLLKAPGWLHQLCPTLHWGLASAVLPHRLETIPHAFLLHANTQGGASGSPVFREDGSVVGMVYMVIHETLSFGGRADEGDRGVMIYQVPTSLTGCVPREVIGRVLGAAEENARSHTGRPPFTKVLSSLPWEVIEPGQSVTGLWPGTE